LSKPNFISKFKSSAQTYTGGIIFILLFAAIGIYLLTTSHAATPYVRIAASSGQLGCNATLQSDSTASGGSYVKFGGASCGTGGSSGKFIISVNNSLGYGTSSNEPVALLKNIGVTWTRNDYSASYVSEAKSAGIHVLPIYDNGPDGNCTGTSPSQVAADISQDIGTLQQNGVTTLEICNESYLSETATTYAAQYDAAHKALAGSGIKALAVATGLAASCTSGKTTSPDWIPTVIHNLSGGAAEVDGWTIHPYGPMSGVGSRPCGDPTIPSTNYGWANDVPNWHDIAVNNGSNAPWYVTEVGQCLGQWYTGSGNCSGPVTEATQAADMTQYLNDVATKYTWIVYFNWYASCDDPSGLWGIFNREGSSGNGACDSGTRQAYTALQTWIAANRSHVLD
jgi:hypothetical protein